MLKDYYNEIIPPWDSRYGKIGHLWKKYQVDDLMYKESERIVYYYLPPELLLTSYYGTRGLSFDNNPKEDSYDNWVSAFKSRDIIQHCLNLSLKDYFDLLIRKVNNKFEVERCKQCKSPLKFSERLSQGYSKRGWFDSRVSLFCSNSCHATYEAFHLDQYEGKAEAFDRFLEASQEFKTIVKRLRTQVLNSDSENLIFYLATTENALKFGVTKDPEIRKRINSSCFKYPFTTFHSIIKLPKEEAANLEAIIKLELNTGEYLEFSSLPDIIKIIHKIIRNRPIPNPFE